MKTPITDAIGASINVDIAKLFGFSPISIRLPLPRIPYPFAEYKTDPLGIPYRKWRVRYQGWRDGKRGIPQADATELSACEEEIVTICKKRITGIEKYIYQYKIACTQVLKSAEMYTVDVENSFNALTSKFNDWIATWTDELNFLDDLHTKTQQELKDHEDKLNQFVLEHKLRSKIPPRKKSLPEQYADIVLVAILDIFLSYWIISTKANLDQIQAIGLSAIACSINILVGCVVGKHFLHNARHTQHWGKWILGALGGSFMVALVMADYMFALWRDAGQTDFVSLPLSLDLSPLSFLLLILNLTIFSLAVFKGMYEFAPSHPGHAELWVAFKQSEAAVTRQKAEYMARIYAIRTLGFAAIEQVRLAIGEHCGKLKSVRAELQGCITALKAHAQYWPKLTAHLQSLAVTLVKIYREASFSRRKEKAPPSSRYLEAARDTLKIDLSAEEMNATQALALLTSSEEKLQQFHAKFEGSIVPMVREAINDAARKALDSNPVQNQD